MNFEFRKDFTEDEYENLSKQDVCLDDWDYALITYDLDQFEEILVEKDDWVFNEKINKYENVPKQVTVFSPKDYYVENLLRGCCDNTWYQIVWNDKPAVIGFAYH